MKNKRNKENLIKELINIYSECNEFGWNGDGDDDGSYPITNGALDQAIQFVSLLNENDIIPEAAPCPDGSIELDWMIDKEKMLSVEMSGGISLPYSFLNNASGIFSGHDIEDFDGKTIPEGLRSLITQYSNMEKLNG